MLDYLFELAMQTYRIENWMSLCMKLGRLLKRSKGHIIITPARDSVVEYNKQHCK